MTSSIVLTIALLALTTLILSTARLLSILPRTRSYSARPPRHRRTLRALAAQHGRTTSTATHSAASKLVSSPAAAAARPAHLLIVLGSGGHTAEMFAMLRDLDTASYPRRTYVVGAGDPISASRAVAHERALLSAARAALAAAGPAASGKTGPGECAGERAGDGEEKVEEALRECYGRYEVVQIPRARRVGQSALSAPVSCARAFVAALRVLLGQRDASNAVTLAAGDATAAYEQHGSSSSPLDLPPAAAAADAPDLILANGPATAAILILASIALRFVRVSGHHHGHTHTHTRILYVESLARVTSLSLSARCVAWAVDRLLVQWVELEGRAGGRAEYAGLLVLAGLGGRLAAW